MSDLKAKISEYVEAAYLHGLSVADLDAGEVDPPRDISEVAWITDTLMELMDKEINTVLDAAIKEQEVYETGTQYSTPKARFVNAIEKSVPVSELESLKRGKS